MSINTEQYEILYAKSISDPEGFWGEVAESYTWHQPWTRVKNTRFSPDVSIKWFEGAKTNLSENCLDRHLPARANQTAIIWEGDDPSQSRTLTYAELHAEVCKFANVLKNEGVKAGDRVTIYLPMIPEAAIAMLACTRIGAVHSVVFAGFSASALAGRIQDCSSTLVITADESVRGGKALPLKNQADEALKACPGVTRMIVVRRTRGEVSWDASRDRWWHELVRAASTDCPPASMDAEAPLFILYTSGSTGKPKGVLHTTGGYMVYIGHTFKTTFDYDNTPSLPNPRRFSASSPVGEGTNPEVFWCSADVGWVTGHSYTVYGPLLNGATTLMFEGVPQYPDWSRMWQIIDKYKVAIFYTAPTAIRAMMREGDAWVEKTSRTSLRLLGSVGEPINPEAWRWYHDVVGEKRCPIVDTWWQTETGGHMITPLPYAQPLKPGAAAFPFFGVKPVIVDNTGKPLEGECEGLLCLTDSWPAQARTLYGDHDRFEKTYFSQYPGMYFTGDGAKRDADGYYWITGRVDDVLNVSGHRLGTAEIESALVAHHDVAEAAVVGMPHDIKGQGIYAYVTLKTGVSESEPLVKELKAQVRKHLSPIATPDVIHFASALPKTRSGKIMRRILRKIAEGERKEFGDISTLTDPEVVKSLLKSVK